MKTILMIDDEMYARDYLAKLLENQGYRVFTAGNGEDGIGLFAQHRPDYVFLDVLLPGIDGEEVFRQIKNIDPEAYIIFMTGTELIFSHQDAVAMGARGYLPKPILPNQILAAIRQAEQSSAVPPDPDKK
ncbi:MAG: response regulator [Elusimicrobia bacterium]|nr:response regulator [Elusimicrobiota bacterium]